MTYFLGIDPGITGAICFLDSEGALIWTYRTPVISGKKKEYDIHAMRDLIQKADEHSRGHILCGIEKVGTLPSDGRVGAFRFGVGYGLWLGLLSGLSIPFHEIPPQRWQAKLLAGLPRGPKIKQSCVKAAKARHPEIPIHAKADWGMADAALIAAFTRRVHQGKD